MPVALVPPTTLVPVDTFNRADETLSDAGRWTNGIGGSSETGLSVSSNTLACTVSTTCTAWRNNAQYGPDVEVWAKIATLPGAGNALRLYARLQQPGSGAFDGYMLRTNELAGPDEVYLEREDNGAITRLLTLTQDLSAGDTLLLRAKGSILEVWRNNGSSWSRLGLAVDSTYATIGSAGIGLRGTSGRLDDFGARTLGGASAPTAPLSLQATSGNAQVALSWSPPASDGGSQLSGYRVYRGTSPGGEGPTAIGTPSGTSYTDTTAVNGTTYYYKVTAVNSVGEGPASNEASATPAAIVPPASPLVAVDSFDRANENPLSGLGPVDEQHRRRHDGAEGSTSSSNTLACSTVDDLYRLAQQRPVRP